MPPSALFYKNLHSAAGKFAHSVVCGNTYAPSDIETIIQSLKHIFLEICKYCKFGLTLSVPEKLKNLIYEVPVVPQALNINN